MRNVLDLDLRGRTLLAIGYLGLQGVAVVTGYGRPDRVFAFQMFNESSRILITLSRRVNLPGGATTVVATDGTWEAHDREGNPHRFAWRDRVKDPMLGALGRSVHASYGAAAQLDHLQGALDDVAQHLDGDAETRSLVADVRIERNGRAAEMAHLESAERRP